MRVGQGRSALVTGASGGIGAAVAGALAAAGYAVTVTGRRAEALTGLAAGLGPAATPVVANLRDDESRAALVASHRARHGGLDALVICAGMGRSVPLAESRPRHFDEVFAVNTRAAFCLLAESLDLLCKAAESGAAARVLAISSLTATYPEVGLAAYSASKAALVSLCRSVNAEHAADGVLATAICPGYVNTVMSDWKKGVIAPEDMITAADIADAVTFVLGLSRAVVVPEIPMARAASTLYEA